MAEGQADSDNGAPIRSLAEMFEKDSKRFEWMAKQYYDLFAYHAAQRLTAFNFFLVSLSFFSTAYATLISRSDPAGLKYYSVAGSLAFAAFLLVVAFARLDKRNEQIIGINEKPLIRIQRAIRLGLSPGDGTGDEVWETFVQAERSVPYRSFGDILPLIYTLAATACAAGAMYGFSGPGEGPHPLYFPLWIALSVAAGFLIRRPIWTARDGAAAMEEAAKVVRMPRDTSRDDLPAPVPPAVVGDSTLAAPSAGTRASDSAAKSSRRASRKDAGDAEGPRTRGQLD